MRAGKITRGNSAVGQPLPIGRPRRIVAIVADPAGELTRAPHDRQPAPRSKCDQLAVGGERRLSAAATVISGQIDGVLATDGLQEDVGALRPAFRIHDPFAVGGDARRHFDAGVEGRAARCCSGERRRCRRGSTRAPASRSRPGPLRRQPSLPNATTVAGCPAARHAALRPSSSPGAGRSSRCADPWPTGSVPRDPSRGSAG